MTKIGLVLVSLSLTGLVSPVQAQANAQSACTSTVRFDFEKKAAMADGLAGKLELRAAESQGEPLVLPAKLGAPVTAQLPCASQWEVTPVFPDTWGPRTTVAVGGVGETLASRMKLWPLGRVTGSVKVAGKDEKLPKLLVITTLAPRTPAQREVPKGLLDCPIDKDGQWQCPPLPATTFDLVISAEGFIPQYRWDFSVPAGKTADLGTLELKRGASVAGWVGVEEGKIADSCKARLVPLMRPGGGGARIAERIAETAVEARVRKDGFFQLVGVSPGTYTLEIRQPGFAVTTMQPIEVWPQLETFLRDPVILKRPLRIELTVSPPLDWLGRPWQVLAFNASEESASFSGEAIFNGAADEQGLVTIPDQPPGRFRVFVSDALNNQLATRTFRIAGPEDASQIIQLELLTVRGKVRLGKEPLAATLWFGGRHGAEAVRMESDGEGTFHGILPRADWWRVDIASTEPRFETRTKVKVVNGKDSAEVEINLPDTHVFGKVLDDAGRPAPGASVGFSTAEGDHATDVDDAGRFELRGLMPGMALAAASLRTARDSWTSDRLPFFVQEGSDVGPIELRLRKSKKVKGMVQSSRGPVPGASVVVIPLSPTVMFPGSARTELDGTFSAQIPGPTLTAAAVVSPPGHTLRAFLLRLDEPNTPVLSVDQQGGELELLFPEKPPDGEKEGISLWVFQNGLPITIDVLYRWILGHGRDVTAQERRLAVPEVAPGEYRACLVAQAVLAQWQDSGWTAPYAKCTVGELAAGGSLRLDLSKP